MTKQPKRKKTEKKVQPPKVEKDRLKRFGDSGEEWKKTFKAE